MEVKWCLLMAISATDLFLFGGRYNIEYAYFISQCLDT